MKRLGRQFVRLVTGYTLLASLIVGFLWTQSYFASEWVPAGNGNPKWTIQYHRGPEDDGLFLQLTSWRGSVQFTYCLGARDSESEFQTFTRPNAFGPVDLWHKQQDQLGSLGVAASRDKTGRSLMVRVQYWLIFGVLITPAAIAFARFVARAIWDHEDASGAQYSLAKLRRLVFHSGAAMSTLFMALGITLWMQSHACPASLSIGWPSATVKGWRVLWSVYYSVDGRLICRDTLTFEQTQIDVKTHSAAWARCGNIGNQLRKSIANWYGQSGFFFEPGTTSPSRLRDRTIAIPYWAVVTPAFAFPTAWVIRWRRVRNARRVGHCTTCGYDLRATPERCPECGKVASSTKGSAT